MVQLAGVQVLTPTTIIVAGLAVPTLYFVVRGIYLLFFHPLAKYPGPKIAALSDLWFFWALTSDRMPFTIHALHRKYGDVVRIGPNEVSFATSQAYQEIYGHVSKGKQRFLKTEFYDNGDPNPRISATRDPEHHARQRKSLSNAFSAKSLRDQEIVVQKYMDMFVRQIANVGKSGEKALNMSDVFNWLTFDIIGDLAFGEPFGAVQNGRPDPWVSILLDSVLSAAFTTVVKKMPWMKFLVPYMLPKGAMENLKKHKVMSRAKAKKRIELGDTGRDDFFSHMLKKGTMSEGELLSQSYTLIIAGSETTATSLSATTFYLLKNPDTMKKLQEEVRTAFSSLEQITGDSTAGLQYLDAVIEESMRLFPPVPLGLPRYSPGAMVDGNWMPAGTTVHAHPFAMCYDRRYWKDPESYLPERWIGDGFGDDKKASQPFSTGPRACLGINLANLEMRIIVAKLVYAFDWEMAQELDDWLTSCQMRLLWKKADIWVKYHPRDVQL